MATLSKVEHVKLESNYLRGTLQSELENSEDHFIDTSELLLKFHGIYQQSDRDVRKARKAQGLSAQHSFMIRVAIAGGVLSKAQYLELDDLSDQLANSTLRITTRQAIQYRRLGALRQWCALRCGAGAAHRVTNGRRA